MVCNARVSTVDVLFQLMDLALRLCLSKTSAPSVWPQGTGVAVPLARPLPMCRNPMPPMSTRAACAGNKAQRCI